MAPTRTSPWRASGSREHRAAPAREGGGGSVSGPPRSGHRRAPWRPPGWPPPRGALTTLGRPHQRALRRPSADPFAGGLADPESGRFRVATRTPSPTPALRSGGRCPAVPGGGATAPNPGRRPPRIESLERRAEATFGELLAVRASPRRGARRRPGRDPDRGPIARSSAVPDPRGATPVPGPATGRAGRHPQPRTSADAPVGHSRRLNSSRTYFTIYRDCQTSNPTSNGRRP